MRRRSLLACGAAWPMGAGADAPALVRQAEAGDLAALRRLLDAGVPVDARDARRRTALLVATHANHIDVAQLLIQRGADVNAKDEMQDSPFLFAGAEGRLEILRLKPEGRGPMSAGEWLNGARPAPGECFENMD